ncbi:hypothetical protein RD110_10920 [Rhodoferax koreense]|uniref:Uncharacterized protein n=1 Tax=Rhodoferax koreensis TaxID=1842727 RepID=A0A1P8JV47_9BURK|nr:hypothetical protein [Rhodoferax koreense]APW37639.1 hypothetical protein RD110_10920 [Rhodoferax koreense]
MSQMIVCSFSGGIDEMKRADQRDPVKVLRVLVRDGRYSCFDASANLTIARTITNMHHKALIYGGKKYGRVLKLDNTLEYPWSKVVLAEGGERLLADHPEGT